MTVDEFLNSESDIQPVRQMAYGPVVGEYHHAAMYGPNQNALGRTDVAASPDTGLGQGDLIMAEDGTLHTVADWSYLHPDQPTHKTIEFRDRQDQGHGFIKKVNSVDDFLGIPKAPSQAQPQQAQAAPESAASDGKAWRQATNAQGQPYWFTNEGEYSDTPPVGAAATSAQPAPIKSVDDFLGISKGAEPPTYAPQVQPTPQELSTLEAPEGSPQREDINRSVAGNVFAPPGRFAQEPTLAETIKNLGIQHRPDEVQPPLAPREAPLPEQGRFEQGGVLGVLDPALEAGESVARGLMPRTDTWAHLATDLGSFATPPVQSVQELMDAPENARKDYANARAQMEGKSLSELPFPERLDPVTAAQQMPEGPEKQQALLNAGANVVAQMLMAKGIAHGIARPEPSHLRTEPLVPEPPPSPPSGPTTIAQDVSRALERRFTLQPTPPEAPPQLAPSIPIEETLPRTAPPLVSPETGFGHYPTEAPTTEPMPVRTEFGRLPGAPEPQLSPLQKNGQILERRQGILDRKAELEARAANGEQGLEGHLAAVEAELNDTATNPVVHAPPVEVPVRHGEFAKPGYTAVETPPEGPVQAPVAETPPEPYTPEAAAARATSTKNVVTAAEREARGLPPAEEAAARDFGTVWDESAKDTAAPARLVASLKVEPRAVSDVENAHILRRQIELRTEHDAMRKAVNEATDPAVAAEARQRLEAVRNDLQDVYDVGKAAGIETARGLSARQMLADEDYALTNMEATTRALVNDGKPLSEAQLSEVAKLHERIRTAEDKLAAYESQDIFNQSLRAQPRRPVLSFLDEQAVKARERIKARKNRLYADPLGVTQVAHLADEAIIGASHIARGVTKFADWSAQMVSEFGDRIKPYLAALFEKSKQQFKAASAGLKKAPVTYAEREARALAGEKKGIITRTEKLRGRAEVVEAGHPFGEFEPLRRRPPRMDPEKARLQYEYQKAKEAFDRGIYEAELKKRSLPKKIFGTVREAWNLPRSLLSSMDFSAVRRQGGIYTMIHPLAARHAFRAMFEATKSEQGYFKVMQEIRDRPNAPEYNRYGLELTDIGPVTRAKMEEQFQSRWAEKIPGVSHSQRAYTAFLNRARADWFDALKNSLADEDKPLTPAQGKAIANAVNVFTGRGAMSPKWAQSMTALNDVFFAARWRASRFQTLIGQPLWKNSGARGVIAGEYAKALIGYASILSLVAWGTKNSLHPMEKNPVSTEAGKLRIGNTRVDFLQGLQQPTVLLSRLLSGRTKTQSGEIRKIYGDVGYGKTTASDVITHFLRSSLAPVPGGIWNVLEQKNVVGEPVTLPSTVKDLTVPLLGQDIYDAMKEQGVPTATALGLLALFGDSIQTYSPRVAAPKKGHYERKLY